MKPIFTTLTALLFAVACLGQTYTLRTFDPHKSDTTACWFKEVFIDTTSNFSPIERWVKGYLVRFPYASVALNSIASYKAPSNEYFIYLDRKRVSNTVISYITITK